MNRKLILLILLSGVLALVTNCDGLTGNKEQQETADLLWVLNMVSGGGMPLAELQRGAWDGSGCAQIIRQKAGTPELQFLALAWDLAPEKCGSDFPGPRPSTDAAAVKADSDNLYETIKERLTPVASCSSVLPAVDEMKNARTVASLNADAAAKAGSAAEPKCVSVSYGGDIESSYSGVYTHYCVSNAQSTALKANHDFHWTPELKQHLQVTLDFWIESRLRNLSTSNHRAEAGMVNRVILGVPWQPLLCSYKQTPGDGPALPDLSWYKSIECPAEYPRF